MRWGWGRVDEYADKDSEEVWTIWSWGGRKRDLWGHVNVKDRRMHWGPRRWGRQGGTTQGLSRTRMHERDDQQIGSNERVTLEENQMTPWARSVSRWLSSYSIMCSILHHASSSNLPYSSLIKQGLHQLCQTCLLEILTPICFPYHLFTIYAYKCLFCCFIDVLSICNNLLSCYLSQ